MHSTTGMSKVKPRVKKTTSFSHMCTKCNLLSMLKCSGTSCDYKEKIWEKYKWFYKLSEFEKYKKKKRDRKNNTCFNIIMIICIDYIYTFLFSMSRMEP